MAVVRIRREHRATLVGASAFGEVPVDLELRISHGGYSAKFSRQAQPPPMVGTGETHTTYEIRRKQAGAQGVPSELFKLLPNDTRVISFELEK
jgi:hypothetical protein